MSLTAQSKGVCAFCGTVVAKGVAQRHLSACAQRQAAIKKAEQKRTEHQTLYHLRVEDVYRKEYWLDLEVRGSATLRALDNYLREIWLECCGHLSEFTTGGWRGEELPFSRKIADVFGIHTKLTHFYDFGTTSETLVKLVGTREGAPTTRHPIALMMRNVMPEAKCIECEKPAAWLCMECVIEEDVWGTLCDKHMQTHPHRVYGAPVRMVNSPRMGMCGYVGLAEPPY